MNGIPLQDPNGSKIHVNVVSAPVPGDEWAWTPDANSSADVLSVSMIVATDANAATRTVKIKYDDGTRDTLLCLAHIVQTANQTIQYNFYQGRSYNPVPPSPVFQGGSLPIGFIINAGWSIRSDITSIQIGDQISAIVLVWKRFIDF